MPFDIDIAPANAGRRLETVLVDVLAQVPRSRMMKWLRTGKIRLNGGRTRPRATLAEGDVLRLPFDPSRELLAPWGEEAADSAMVTRRPKLPPPIVLYEDADIILLNKPAHLASHPGMGHHDDSLIARVLAYLHAHDAPVGERPGLAQRLDAGVTGIGPCGKHARALKILSGPPHGPALQKSYVALVQGHVPLLQGSITAKLRVTDAPMGHVPKVVVDAELGLVAHTDYTVVQRLADVTLLRLTLRTGRTHQIRAHLRHLGHPLLGDPRYGDAERNAYLRDSFGIDRPLLHAAELTLSQPSTGAPIHVQAPLPADMMRILAAFAATGAATTADAAAVAQPTRARRSSR